MASFELDTRFRRHKNGFDLKFSFNTNLHLISLNDELKKILIISSKLIIAGVSFYLVDVLLK